MEPEVDCSKKIIGIYEINESIGKGAFADVYRVTDCDGKSFAAKFVWEDCYYLLERERDVMTAYGSRRIHGEPCWYYFGKHESHYVLVLDLFGPTLQTIKEKYGRLSLKSSVSLGIQIISRLQALHDRGFLHCDLKPDNVVVGKEGEDRKCLYLIDFGAAVKIKPGEASKRNNLVLRNKDLEAAVGLIIYVLKLVSWDIICSTFSLSAGYMQVNSSELELLEDLPIELKNCHSYVTNNERCRELPNYTLLRGYLQTALNGCESCTDGEFEWTRED